MSLRWNRGLPGLLIACVVAALASNIALGQTCSVPGQAGEATITTQPNSFFASKFPQNGKSLTRSS